MKDADFRSFIKRERQKLIRYVRSLLTETAEMDAEDVVHDVLVKMLEKPASTAPLSNLTSYVYRSVKNRVIDVARTRKSTVSLHGDTDDRGLMDLLLDLNPNAFELLQTEQGERQLFEALSRLSDVERRVIIAHEFEGVPFAELSTAWRIPQNTLLSHKSRGMKKLKTYLMNPR